MMKKILKLVTPLMVGVALLFSATPARVVATPPEGWRTGGATTGSPSTPPTRARSGTTPRRTRSPKDWQAPSGGVLPGPPQEQCGE